MKTFQLVLLFTLIAAALVYWQSNGESPLGPASNHIRWETQSEENNFGYDVYRGPSEQGPFTRINAEPIPGAGTTDLPQHYDYEDTAIQPDTVYWYYVESIALDGERKRATPTYSSQPKTVRGE